MFELGKTLTAQLYMNDHVCFHAANECEVDNGGCEGTCANTLTSFECRCEEGYTLASDGHSCEGK